MISLVDADSLVYLAGFVAQKTHYDVVVSDGKGGLELIQLPSVKAMKEEKREIVDYKPEITMSPLSYALQVVKEKMSTIVHRYGSKMEVYIRGDKQYNFREKYATIAPYKGNRVADKPVYYEDIRAYLVKQWKAIKVEEQEVDDEIGCRTSELGTRDVVIVSPDKDLDQFPGKHWNYRNGTEYVVDPSDAMFWFWMQTLTGDPSDNIKGCWKMGSKGAELLLSVVPLERPEEVWRSVKKAYETSQELEGCPYSNMTAEQAATENARLVYMRRKRYEIWQPPGQDKAYDYPPKAYHD